MELLRIFGVLFNEGQHKKTTTMNKISVISRIGTFYTEGVISVNEAANMVSCIEGVKFLRYSSNNGLRLFHVLIDGEQVNISF